MESNEQTELTSKIDTLIDGEQADSSGKGGWEMEGLSKKEKELMDMDNSMVIAGWGRGGRGFRGDKW